MSGRHERIPAGWVEDQDGWLWRPISSEERGRMVRFFHQPRQIAMGFFGDKYLGQTVYVREVWLAEKFDKEARGG